MKLDTYTDKLNEYTQNMDPAQMERTVSLIGGGTLVALGLVRRSWLSLPLALVGGGLMWRAVNREHEGEMVEMGEKGTPTSAVVRHGHGICVEKAITINRSPEELYQWWHNLQNLPQCLEFLDSVTMLDERRSHWVAKAPPDTQIEWDAEIINDIPNELIAWRSVDGSEVRNAGSVHFDRAPDGRGTRVKVELEYEPPAGKLGAAVAKLFGKEPSQMIYTDLRHLKELMETGEVATTEGQPHGSRNPLSKFKE